MPLDLTALEAELTRDDSVTDSAVTLITALMAEVEANKANPAAIQGIVDRVRASTDKLSAAVVAGTPQAPPTPEPPAPSGRR